MSVSHVDLVELRIALDDWARHISGTHGAEGVYLFGSLVYRDGAQFTHLSDVDLVIKFGTSMNALTRATWIKDFLPTKKQLEITLLGILQRRLVEPLASVVTVTQTEIELDVQKENQPSFYSSNVFIDLLSGTTNDGLPGAATAAPCSRLLAGSVSMTQKIRHQYLGVAANNRGVLQPFDGEDRVPKAVMRAAAMARTLADPGLGKGAEYDTRLGLDHLTRYLLEHEKDDTDLEHLSRLLSERRGARGEGGPISPFHQLLLAEIVFDLAVDARNRLCRPSVASPSPVSPPPRASGSAAVEAAVIPSPEPFPPVNEALSSAKSGPAELTQNVAKSPRPSFRGMTSLGFFLDRFQQAFPGVRHPTWFEGAGNAIERLARLLQPPLAFSDAAPIWWWRDGNLDIQNFEQIDESMVLINHDELKIRRVAAIPGPSYKWNFVYVEVDAMTPTGLYDTDQKKLIDRVNISGYASEEYGLYAGYHIFSRSEYDDGGTYIDGKYVDTTNNSTFRVRYLSTYNFIIAAKNSPINNVEFDQTLVGLMNRALKEDAKLVIEELSREVALLPLRRFE